MISIKIEEGLLIEEDSFIFNIKKRRKNYIGGNFKDAFSLINQFGIGEVVATIDASCNASGNKIIIVKFTSKQIKKIEDLYKVILSEKQQEKKLLEIIYNSLKNRKEIFFLIS